MTIAFEFQASLHLYRSLDTDTDNTGQHGTTRTTRATLTTRRGWTATYRNNCNLHGALFMERRESGGHVVALVRVLHRAADRLVDLVREAVLERPVVRRVLDRHVELGPRHHVLALRTERTSGSGLGLGCGVAQRVGLTLPSPSPPQHPCRQSCPFRTLALVAAGVAQRVGLTLPSPSPPQHPCRQSCPFRTLALVAAGVAQRVGLTFPLPSPPQHPCRQSCPSRTLALVALLFLILPCAMPYSPCALNRVPRW